MNINDVARLAGVSRATVSRFLNDGYVSAEKREAIARVIDETGYVPSVQAQTLRTGRTNFVGVIIPKLSSESVSLMVDGISAGLAEGGQQVLLANTANDEEAEVAYLRSLDARMVDGIILVATIMTPAHREAAAALDVPLVVLGQATQVAPCVHHDDYGALRKLADRVLSCAQHPAFIGVTDADLAAGAARRKGFRDACAAYGLEGAPEATSDFTTEGGYACARELLSEHPETDTIMCATDAIAAGAVRAVHELGRSVPRDVQVTGVGGGMVSTLVSPVLTTVRYSYEEAGEAAAKQLVELMAGRTPEKREVVPGYEVLKRDSTRC